MDASASENRGPGLRTFNIVCLIIATIAIALRFWSRALTSDAKSPRFWWDDWTALLAWVFTTTSIALEIWAISLGLGRHVNNIPPADLLKGSKAIFIIYFIYDTSISITKCSALLFYNRIFNARASRFRYALWFTQTLVALWLIIILFITAFSCKPVEKAWNPTVPGTCFNTDNVWLGSAVTSMIIDLIILVLPMPMLWRLQLQLGRKIMITGVFICGYCVILVSIGRLVTIELAGASLAADLTYVGITPIYWLSGEAPISILSICLPSIFFLVRRSIRDGPASLFSSKTASRSRMLRQTKNSTKETLPTSEDRPMELDNCSFESSTRTTVHGNLKDTYKSPLARNRVNHLEYSESTTNLTMPKILVQNVVDVHSEEKE